MSDILRLATEDSQVAQARERLHRGLSLASREAVTEELDEAIAAARRACDEAEKLIINGRRRGRRWNWIVAEIYRHAVDPWISLRLGATELVNVRAGSYVAVIGGEGSGKSSFVMQLLAQHERDVGPAIYVTPELDADEAGARVIGQDRGATWREVLTGQVPADKVIAHDRLVILEREDATVSRLVDEVEGLRTEFPGQPILVAWDHLQAQPGDGDGERLRIAKLSTELRRLAKRLGVVLVAVSQSSREGAKKLDSGELLGAEASRTGAESSQIERDAYATIALGDRKKLDDGTESRSISVGKNRMGEGDMVFSAIYTGRDGRWSIQEAARAAAEVRAEREEKAISKKLETVKLAIIGGLATSTAPLTREEVKDFGGSSSKLARRVVATMLASGELVEVARKRPKSRSWLVWTPAKAKDAGVALLTDTEVEER